MPLVYLDSANTSQKPRQVLDALREHYERHNANVHRAVHTLGEEATAAYEGARDKVAALHRRAVPRRGRLHQERHRGAQPGGLRARLAARRTGSAPGDEIVITEMEHHSNIVPWQLLCRADRRDAALVRHHRRRPARPVRIWTS